MSDTALIWSVVGLVAAAFGLLLFAAFVENRRDDRHSQAPAAGRPRSGVTLPRPRMPWTGVRDRGTTIAAWVTSWFWWHDSWPAARDLAAERLKRCEPALYWAATGRRHPPDSPAARTTHPSAGDVPGRDMAPLPPAAAGAPALPAGDLIPHAGPWDGHPDVHAFPADEEVA